MPGRLMYVRRRTYSTAKNLKMLCTPTTHSQYGVLPITSDPLGNRKMVSSFLFFYKNGLFLSVK